MQSSSSQSRSSHYRQHAFVFQVNAWRWMKQRIGGRKGWYGRRDLGYHLKSKLREKLEDDGIAAEFANILNHLGPDTFDGILQHWRRAKLPGPIREVLVKAKRVLGSKTRFRDIAIHRSRSDGTDNDQFEAIAESTWKSATPEARLDAMRALFTLAASPPGLGAHRDQPTFALRSVNTLYTRDADRPRGVTKSWERRQTQKAALHCAEVMDALERCVRYWAAHKQPALDDWKIIAGTVSGVTFLVDPSNIPDPNLGETNTVQVRIIPEALLEANDWPSIIRETASAACGSFFGYLSGRTPGDIPALRACAHIGCGDFFLSVGSQLRCPWHVTSKARGSRGKSAGRYHKRKPEWELTAGDRSARRDLLARWHNLRAASPLITRFLSHRFGRKDVTGTTCSYATYRKHGKAIFRVPNR